MSLFGRMRGFCHCISSILSSCKQTCPCPAPAEDAAGLSLLQLHLAVDLCELAVWF